MLLYPAHDRARRGIAYVPQGREIFPLLTVAENLRSGFAALARGESEDACKRLIRIGIGPARDRLGLAVDEELRFSH